MTGSPPTIKPKRSTSPGRRLVHLLKSPYKRTTSSKALKFRNLRKTASSSSKGGKGMRILSCTPSMRRSPRKPEEEAEVVKDDVDADADADADTEEVDVGELPKSTIESLAESMREPVPYTTPMTPSACPSMTRKNDDNYVDVDADAEAACQSFESYLVEMIAEDKKAKDLVELEELVRGWNELKSPIFVELVCGFYVEMCKDLFFEDEHEAHDNDNDDDHNTNDDNDDDNNNDALETQSCPETVT